MDFHTVCFCTENGSNKLSPLDFKHPAVFRRPFSFQGRLKASKQPDFKLLCFYPLYIPLTAFTDPTTGVPDLPTRL